MTIGQLRFVLAVARDLITIDCLLCAIFSVTSKLA